MNDSIIQQTNLEIDGDGDHVVGADVIGNKAEIAVGRNEGQNLLVFPSGKERRNKKKIRNGGGGGASNADTGMARQGKIEGKNKKE